MSKCGKCGREVKQNAKFCSACGGASLDEKKARVIGQERSRIKPGLIAAVVVILVAAGFGFTQLRPRPMAGQSSFAPSRDASARTSKATAVTPQNGDIRIPVKSVEDGNAHFFAYASAGKTITFFVMKAADGTLRTAFDACMACNHAKLGYRQEGSAVVCNNCGMAFAPQDIGKVKGGCNPIPVQKTSDGQTIVLKAKDLDEGVQYF